MEVITMDAETFRTILSMHKKITRKDRIVYIFRRFKLNIPSNLDYNLLEYNFEDDRMEFIDKKNKVKYSLVLDEEDESYSFIRTYSDYELVFIYGYDQILYQKIIFFDLPNNNTISLSIWDDPQNNVVRLVKSHEESADEIILFERCYSLMKYLDSYEVYKKVAPDKDNYEEHKIVTTPNNLYYYSVNRRNLKDLPLNSASLETSCILDKPTTPFIGHGTYNNSLLAKNLNIPFPTLSFRGNFIRDKESIYGPILLYIVNICKINNSFNIKVWTMYGTEGKFKTETFDIDALNNGAITIGELNYLKNELPKYLSSEYVSYCLSEIDEIIKCQKVRLGQSLKDADIIDLRMALYDDFEHLAYDIYENLSYFDNLTDYPLTENKVSPNQIISLKKEM